LQKKAYPVWEKMLDDLLASNPKGPEKHMLMSRLANQLINIFGKPEKKVIDKILSLDPGEDMLIDIMFLMPEYEENLLPLIKDEKKRLIYLMRKEVK